MGGRGAYFKRLPNHRNAEIARNKLKNYLLNPKKSPGKAKFFRGLGYNMRNFRRFEADIREGLKNNPAHGEVTNKYGHTVTAYTVDMPLGINQTAMVLTSWQCDEGSKIPRFITAYPAKKKKGGKA